MATVEDLKRIAADNLREAMASAPEDRTAHLRATAEAYIDAREHFYTKTGDPDWQGRTYAYRQFVREVMQMARIPAADLASVQAAVRYHTGNVLRDRLSTEEIEDLGLRQESPRERSVEKRSKASAVLTLVTGGGPLTTLSAVTEAAELMASITKRMDLTVMSPTDRAKAQALLFSVAGEVGHKASGV